MKSRFSRILLPAATLGLLLIAVLVYGLNTQSHSSATTAQNNNPNNNSNNGKYQAITLEIIDKLEAKHFVDLPLDDALSERLLDNYLERLDPNKAFFYRADIDAFEPYRTTLDDQLRQGDNSVGFTIHAKLRQRMEQRLQALIDFLKDDDQDFDFTLDETMATDPENIDWPKDSAAADDLWRKRIKAFLLAQKLAGEPIDEARQQLVRRYQNQLTRLQKNTDDDVYELYINAFAELYDPHTSYLAPRTAENFAINMSLSLEGIGAVLQTEDEHTKVVRLVTGGPAHKQGELQAADLITGVAQGEVGDMVDVIGWRLDEVVSLIRGPKDTIVRLQVTSSDPTATGSKTIRIKREKVKLEDQAARKAIFQVNTDSGADKGGTDKGGVYRVGVIKIPAFYMDFAAYRERDPNYRSTTRDVSRLLVELMQEGVDGIVIDLRNNGGGSLQEATNLTDLFIDKGPVVQIGKNGLSSTTRSRNKALYRGPLVVMINRLSASASEIFAGAIQDYQRGLIVGSQSFGKGTVQSLTPLESTGDLKITESKFYRVSGDSTQHRGIIPDIRFPELVDADIIGESTYDTALPWSKTRALKYARYLPINTMIPLLTERHSERATLDPDFIFLGEQKSLLERFGDKEEISLNEARRLQEKEALEGATLELENRRRSAKGLTAFDDYAALKDFNEERNRERAATAGTTVIDLDNDALLKEAGYILKDFTGFLSRDKGKQVAGTLH